MEMRDTIKLSYERACKEGLFIADTQWARWTRNNEDEHSVVFIAYDGYVFVLLCASCCCYG